MGVELCCDDDDGGDDFESSGWENNNKKRGVQSGDLLGVFDVRAAHSGSCCHEGSAARLTPF